MRRIEIEINEVRPHLRAIVIDGVPLTDDEILSFAVADGFGGIGCPRYKMGRFWLSAHGAGEFVGVVIEWARA